MRAVDLINKKRRGAELSKEEIVFFINGLVDGNIPDYQVSAMLMAICFCGMSETETFLLTEAMANSGDTLDLSRFGDKTVDKHSTGGVGDKTSLIVGPIVAALGAKVAKMSGRGLGHTGGTVDKLSAIPGYSTTIDSEQFLSQVEQVGLAIVGQSANLTPADKKMYALRDVTATIDSIPLIASSVMSKKIAAGSHSIVLDVKVGSGAFMKSVDEARELAGTMVEIGRRCGRRVVAVLSNMDTPLGTAVGNSLEIIEAVKILHGEGSEDLREVSITLATQMAALSLDMDTKDAEAAVREAIATGAAFRKMKQWVDAQGGDSRSLENFSLLPQGMYCQDVKSDEEGYVHAMDALLIGTAAMTLGAGRRTADDQIDLGAGIEIYKKTGAFIERGDVLCTLYSNDRTSFAEAERLYKEALRMGPQKPQSEPLIYEIIA